MTGVHEHEVDAHRMSVIEAALSARGITVGSIRPLEASYNGATYLAASNRGNLVLKLRSAFRHVAASRSASALLQRRQLTTQTVVVGPTSTDVGWLLGLSWVPGAHLGSEYLKQASEREVREIGRGLGLALANIHKISGPSSTWALKANQRFHAKLQYASGLSLLDQSLAQALVRRWASLETSLRSAPTSLTHRDLMPGNVLLLDARFGCFIDFEHARMADPLYDFVKLFRSTLSLSPVLREGFHLGYGHPERNSTFSERLVAVQVLEALSAMSYYEKRSDSEGVAKQRQDLEVILDSAASLVDEGGL